jgi:hypothetical protein
MEPASGSVVSAFQTNGSVRGAAQWRGRVAARSLSERAGCRRIDCAAVRFWQQPGCDKVHDRGGNLLLEIPVWGLAIRSAANKTHWAGREEANPVSEMITPSNSSSPGIHDFFEFSDHPSGKRLDALPA